MIHSAPPRTRARRLKTWRRRRKMTLTAAAAWYGVSLAAWSRWEGGQRPIPDHLWKRITEAP